MRTFMNEKTEIPKSIIKILEFMRENGNYNIPESDKIAKFISVNKIRLKNVNFAFIGIDVDEYQILFEFLDQLNLSSNILVNQISFESKDKPLRDILLNIDLSKHSEKEKDKKDEKEEKGLSYVGELEAIYIVKTIFRPMYLEEYISFLEDKNDPIFDPDIIKPLLMDTLNIPNHIREKLEEEKENYIKKVGRGRTTIKKLGDLDLTRSWDQLFHEEFLILGRDCINEIKNIPIHIGRIPFDFDPMISRIFNICYPNMLNSIYSNGDLFSLSVAEKLELMEDWLNIFHLARLYDKMYFSRYKNIPNTISSDDNFNIPNSSNEFKVKVMEFNIRALILVKKEFQKISPLYFDMTEENIKKFSQMDKSLVIEEITKKLDILTTFSTRTMQLFNLIDMDTKEVDLINRIIFVKNFEKIMKFKNAVDNISCKSIASEVKK